MVLLHAGGRHRVDARRRGEAAILRYERGGGVLGDHQAGVHAGFVSEEGRQSLGAMRVEEAVDASLRDRPDLRRGDGQEVGGESERFTVKVAVRFDVSVLEHDRVVDR